LIQNYGYGDFEVTCVSGRFSPQLIMGGVEDSDGPAETLNSSTQKNRRPRTLAADFHS